MNKRIIISLLLFVLVLTGCEKQSQENVENSVPVKIYKIKSESISKYIRITGSITADEDVIVYSKVSERIEKVYVKPGQKVAKDQVLAEQKSEIQKRSMEMANSALIASEAQAKLATQEYERIKGLYSEKAVSQQQFDQAKTSWETAEQMLNQAKASYSQAKEQFDNCFVKAPFGGEVAAVFVEENQMVNMGQPAVQVLSPSKMKAKVNLTGEDIQKVKLGQNVMAKFPTIPNEQFSGRITKINSAIDQMSKALEVEIAFNSNDSRLKSGMFGEFYIEIENRPAGIVIPEDALLPQTEVIINKETGLQNSIKKYFVFTVQKGSAKLIEVKTGIVNNGQIEITSGLNIGDSVVVIGQNIVKEGQTVNVIE